MPSWKEHSGGWLGWWWWWFCVCGGVGWGSLVCGWAAVAATGDHLLAESGVDSLQCYAWRRKVFAAHLQEVPGSIQGGAGLRGAAVGRPRDAGTAPKAMQRRPPARKAPVGLSRYQRLPAFAGHPHVVFLRTEEGAAAGSALRV